MDTEHTEEFEQQEGETILEFYGRMSHQSRFHCLKCHVVRYRENVGGRVLMTDGICGDCVEHTEEFTPDKRLLTLEEILDKFGEIPTDNIPYRDDRLRAVAKAQLDKVDRMKLEDDRIYPCDDCGKLRSKNEGGTTFTICDSCWEKHYRKVAKPDREKVR